MNRKEKFSQRAKEALNNCTAEWHFVLAQNTQDHYKNFAA